MNASLWTGGRWFRRSLFPSGLLAVVAGLWGAPVAGAQSTYSGNYSGLLYAQLSGLVNLPESAVGPVLLTIDSAGAVRVGLNELTGPSSGTVTADGRVTFTPPLVNVLTNGYIASGVLAATNSTGSGGLTNRYRIEAVRVGVALARPAILRQPQSLVTHIGSSALLPVEATGDELSFQWFAGRVVSRARLMDLDGEGRLVQLSFDDVNDGLYVSFGSGTAVDRPKIAAQRTASGLELSWSGPGSVEASSDLGSWTSLPGASPVRVEFSPGARCFRIRTQP